MRSMEKVITDIKLQGKIVLKLGYIGDTEWKIVRIAFKVSFILFSGKCPSTCSKF